MSIVQFSEVNEEVQSIAESVSPIAAGMFFHEWEMVETDIKF